MSDHESATDRPTKSVWKRLFLAFSVVVVSLVVLGIGQYFLMVSRARDRLARIMADLDENDPGWRLEELEAARPTPPEESNSARTVVAVHRMLPKGALDYKVMEPLDNLPPPPELLDKTRADLLQRELKLVASALPLARSLAEKPDGRHQLTFGPNPLNTLLTDQQHSRTVFNLLRYDALDLAQQGDPKGSLRSCQAIVNAARSLDDEPVIISQLIRIAGIAVAGGAIERTLALGEPPVEDLSRLQKLLEEEDAHRTLLVALRGERAIQHKLFTGMSNGAIDLEASPGGGTGSGLTGLFSGWTQKNLARREHPDMLEILGRAIAVARLPEGEQAAGEKEVDDAILALPRTLVLTRLLMPAIRKFGAAARRKLAMVRCLKVLVALEQYRREKGAWPPKLENLTPKLLKRVPLDPFNGKLLRYRPVADGVIVYSVGPDGTDNGGNIDRTKPLDPGTDLGFQLWDVKHRRQPAKTTAAK
jgi:hypothetical protein